MPRCSICGFVLLGIPAFGCASSASDAQRPGAAGSGNLGAAGASAGSAGLPTGSAGSGQSGAPGSAGSLADGGTPGLGGAPGSAGSTAGTGDDGAAAGAGAVGGAAGGMIIVSDNFDSTAAGGPPDPTKWFTTAVRIHEWPDHRQRESAQRAELRELHRNFERSRRGLDPCLRAADGGQSLLRARLGQLCQGNQRRFGARRFSSRWLDARSIRTELRLGVSIPPGFGTAMVDLNLQNPKDGGGGEVTRFSNGFTTGGNPLNMAGTTFDADTWTCVEALFDGGHNEFPTLDRRAAKSATCTSRISRRAPRTPPRDLGTVVQIPEDRRAELLRRHRSDLVWTTWS